MKKKLYLIMKLVDGPDGTLIDASHLIVNNFHDK